MTQLHEQSNAPDPLTDAYTWQAQAMTDVAKFVRAHRLTSPHPLPWVSWTFGPGWDVTADLDWHEDDIKKGLLAVGILQAYADVLDTALTISRTEDGTRNVALVQGRIGPAHENDGERRTLLTLHASFPHDPTAGGCS